MPMKNNKSSKNTKYNLKIKKQQVAKKSQYLLKTDIWNNCMVASLTGYTIEMLKPCLLAMIHFMRHNLTTDKLKYFALEHVKEI